MTRPSPTRKQRALLLAALMVLPVFAGTLALSGSATATEPSSAPASLTTSTSACMTTVQYPEFRTDSSVVDPLRNGSNQTLTKQLTKVAVSSDDGFYRVSAENPNGYCVRFEIQVHDDIFAPAEIPGEVRSANDQYVANWTSVYDWENETMYTRITFTLPANTSATFAPSAARVYSLSWAERAPKQSESFIDRLSDDDDEQVIQKEHKIRASEMDRETPFSVIVPLRHPETREPLEDQTLVYSTDDGDTWRPVPTETTAPVYKETVNNGTALRLTFNDQDVLVKFIANPSELDKMGVGYETWTTGALDTVDSVIPGDYFTVTRREAKPDGEEGS